MMVKAIARAVVEGEGSRGAQSSGDSWTRSSAAMQEGWLDELAAVGGALDSLQVCMSDVSEKVVADFTLQDSEIFKSEIVLPVLQDRQFSSKGGNVSLMHEGEFDACSCEKIRRKNDLHVDGPVVHDMTVLDLAEDLNNDDEREDYLPDDILWQLDDPPNPGFGIRELLTPGAALKYVYTGGPYIPVLPLSSVAAKKNRAIACLHSRCYVDGLYTGLARHYDGYAQCEARFKGEIGNFEHDAAAKLEELGMQTQADMVRRYPGRFQPSFILRELIEKMEATHEKQKSAMRALNGELQEKIQRDRQVHQERLAELPTMSQVEAQLDAFSKGWQQQQAEQAKNFEQRELEYVNGLTAAKKLIDELLDENLRLKQLQATGSDNGISKLWDTVQQLQDSVYSISGSKVFQSSVPDRVSKTETRNLARGRGRLRGGNSNCKSSSCNEGDKEKITKGDEIAIGTAVSLHSLQNEDLNGMHGIVTDFSDSLGKFAIYLPELDRGTAKSKKRATKIFHTAFLKPVQSEGSSFSSCSESCSMCSSGGGGDGRYEHSSEQMQDFDCGLQLQGNHKEFDVQQHVSVAVQQHCAFSLSGNCQLQQQHDLDNLDGQLDPQSSCNSSSSFTFGVQQHVAFASQLQQQCDSMPEGGA
mmetsp:Transcript_48277/g.90424  ORF Transcript_48277/g.90424 Transcript_48277/m.90424 type:complete len:642 (+) Transcript_48277:164-2089(+)